MLWHLPRDEIRAAGFQCAPQSCQPAEFYGTLRAAAQEMPFIRLKKLKPTRVAVLYTTVGGELADDLRETIDLAATAAAVSTTLRSLGHSVRSLPFGKDPLICGRRLRAFRPDIVFNLAECPLDCNEKEPHAAALLELLDLPYTGNDPMCLAVCKNKALAKQILLANDLPTPRFRVLSQGSGYATGLAYPLMVKPLTEDGSLAISEDSVVANKKELRGQVELLHERHRQQAIVEEFLSGREFCLTVLGNGTPDSPYQVFPPGELVYHSAQWKVCSFEAKWNEQHPSYAAVEARYPAAVNGVLRQTLEKMSLQCARVFQISGYARIDFRLNARDQPCVLEINPNPDLSPGAGMTRTVASGGLNYAAFLQEILRLGLAKGAR
jgi:D-alanine-D-alanine ligase